MVNRALTVSNHNAGSERRGLCLSIVEIEVSATELGAKLAAMRVWLGGNKCSLMIDARLVRQGTYLVRLDFDSNADAQKFLRVFDPGQP